MPYEIAVIIGSLRAGSLNRKIAEQLMHIGYPGFRMAPVGIGDLPLYNEDLEREPPRAWQTFRERIRAADALLFVTPEYNRSVPGVLKNAIDIGSRPAGESVWDGKPAGVITASPGAIGGFGANHHLRQMFVFLNVYAMQQPECYLGQASDSFDQDGAAFTERTRKFLANFMEAYSRWIPRFVAFRDEHRLDDRFAIPGVMVPRAAPAVAAPPIVR